MYSSVLSVQTMEGSSDNVIGGTFLAAKISLVPAKAVAAEWEFAFSVSPLCLSVSPSLCFLTNLALFDLSLFPYKIIFKTIFRIEYSRLE